MNRVRSFIRRVPLWVFWCAAAGAGFGVSWAFASSAFAAPLCAVMFLSAFSAGRSFARGALVGVDLEPVAGRVNLAGRVAVVSCVVAWVAYLIAEFGAVP